MLSVEDFRAGLTETVSFSRALIDDLEEDGEGFAWRHGFPETSSARETADYIVGAVQAVGSNMQFAAVGLNDYRALRVQQDSRTRLLISSTGKPFPVPRDSQFDEKEQRLDAAERCFYIGIGSTLDCLAAVLVGIAGLDLDIHRADLGMLSPLSADDRYPMDPKHKRLAGAISADPSARYEQIKAIRGVTTTLINSGPDGWMDWTLGMRNMVVHREHRSELISVEAPRAKAITISRLVAANPRLSNLQGMRAANELLDDFYLHEDLTDTLSGIAGSVNAAVAASIGVLRDTWHRRMREPNLIVQPPGQWKQAGEPIVFAGYQPGSASLPRRTSLTTSPEDWKRMLAGGVARRH